MRKTEKKTLGLQKQPMNTIDELNRLLELEDDILKLVPPILEETEATTTQTRPKQYQPLRQQRALEDVDYWRKRAGWYDDDQSMVSYNAGVMTGYYNENDDDYTPTYSNESSSSSSSSSKSSSFLSGISYQMSDIMVTAAQIFGGLIALVIVIMVIRAMGRKRSRQSRKSSSAKSRARSKSRTRSKSRSRSKSRKRDSADGADYSLMDDNKSHRSSRSGRSSRSSRSKSKSRSKSRTRKDESMLV